MKNKVMDLAPAMLFLFAFILSVSGSEFFSDEKPTEKDPQELQASELHSGELNYTSQVLNFRDLASYSATFTFSGEKGSITLDSATGKVEHKGYTPDEAAAQFWDSVEKAFPNVKAKILKDNPCPKCKP